MLRFLVIALLFLPFKSLGDAYPIRYTNGLIVTEAIIEGLTVFVILDTGAPGLVLNEKYYTPDPAVSIACLGVNGSFECKTRQVNEWQWLGTSAKKTKALVSNLTFLEDAVQQKIHAIIGLSLINEYYVSIDLDRQEIRLEKDIASAQELSFSRFSYINHVPVMQCKVNGQKKILGLDTGSSANYLFGFDGKGAGINAADISPILVVGTGNIKDIKHRVQLNLEVPEGEVALPASFIVDLHDKGRFVHESFDGILGQEFLGDYNLIIHPGKQKILFQPRMENHLVIE